MREINAPAARRLNSSVLRKRAARSIMHLKKRYANPKEIKTKQKRKKSGPVRDGGERPPTQQFCATRPNAKTLTNDPPTQGKQRPKRKTQQFNAPRRNGGERPPTQRPFARARRPKETRLYAKGRTTQGKQEPKRQPKEDQSRNGAQRSFAQLSSHAAVGGLGAAAARFVTRRAVVRRARASRAVPCKMFGAGGALH